MNENKKPEPVEENRFVLNPESSNPIERKIARQIDGSREGEEIEEDGVKYVWKKTKWLFYQLYSHEGPAWDFRSQIEAFLGVGFERFKDYDDESNNDLIREEYPHISHILLSPTYDWRPCDEVEE